MCVSQGRKDKRIRIRREGEREEEKKRKSVVANTPAAVCRIRIKIRTDEVLECECHRIEWWRSKESKLRDEQRPAFRVQRIEEESPVEENRKLNAKQGQSGERKGMQIEPDEQ